MMQFNCLVGLPSSTVNGGYRFRPLFLICWIKICAEFHVVEALKVLGEEGLMVLFCADVLLFSVLRCSMY